MYVYVCFLGDPILLSKYDMTADISSEEDADSSQQPSRLWLQRVKRAADVDAFLSSSSDDDVSAIIVVCVAVQPTNCRRSHT